MARIDPQQLLVLFSLMSSANNFLMTRTSQTHPRHASLRPRQSRSRDTGSELSSGYGHARGESIRNILRMVSSMARDYEDPRAELYSSRENSLGDGRSPKRIHQRNSDLRQERVYDLADRTKSYSDKVLKTSENGQVERNSLGLLSPSPRDEAKQTWPKESWSIDRDLLKDNVDFMDTLFNQQSPFSLNLFSTPSDQNDAEVDGLNDKVIPQWTTIDTYRDSGIDAAVSLVDPRVQDEELTEDTFIGDEYYPWPSFEDDTQDAESPPQSLSVVELNSQRTPFEDEDPYTKSPSPEPSDHQSDSSYTDDTNLKYDDLPWTENDPSTDDVPVSKRFRVPVHKKVFVYGRDDRLPVFLPQMRKFPFSNIARLSTGCTGTLVTPRHVLTAAHCVHNGLGFRDNLEKLKIEIPDTMGFKDYYAQKITIPTGWLRENRSLRRRQSSKRARYDYAVVRLKLAVTGRTKFLPLSVPRPDVLQMDFHFLAFPEYDQQLWRSVCLASQHMAIEDGNLIMTRCDAAVGNSGAAVFIQDPHGGLRVVGILSNTMHVGYHRSFFRYSIITALTWHKLTDICNELGVLGRAYNVCPPLRYMRRSPYPPKIKLIPFFGKRSWTSGAFPGALS